MLRHDLRQALETFCEKQTVILLQRTGINSDYVIAVTVPYVEQYLLRRQLSEIKASGTERLRHGHD